MRIKNDNEYHKHGSSDWATERQLRKAGYFSDSDSSLHLGFFWPSWKQRIRWNGDAGIIINAGPRSGKFIGIGGYNAVTGFSRRTQVFFDSKAEIATTGQDQTPEKRKCAYWAPYKRFDLPQHKINPLGHITIKSERLHSDISVFCENAIPETGSGNAKFFELSARGFCSAFALVVTERDGELTFPAVGDAINLIQQDTSEAHEFEYLMMTSSLAEVRATYGIIMEGKKSGSNAFLSIMAELRNAFACLADPMLRASISSPFHMTLEQITCEGGWNLYLMPESDFIKTWSPVIRTFFSSLKTLKMRHPEAPKQDWHIDEAPLLAPWPMLPHLYNEGAGYGIRPISYTQTFSQMDAIAPNGSALLTAGAAVQIYFGIRDIESAEKLSRILGMQTLKFDNTLAQQEAKRERKRILDGMMRGADPMAAGRELAHLKKAAEHRSEMQRPLMTAPEIMRMPPGEAIMIGDKLPHPVRNNLWPYFERREMAGRYTENRAFSQKGRVRVKTLFGHKWVKEIIRPVAPEFAQFPQYTDGMGVFLGM